jgi:hypothetical protein
MKMTPFMLLALAMTTAAGLTADAQRPSGGADPTLQSTGRPDDRAWTGKYNNHSYGFSVVIPNSLKGHWNSPRCVDGADGCVCMQDHGRIIPLSTEPYEPSRYIEAYPGYMPDLDDPTAAQLVSLELRSIREESRKRSLQIRQRSRITLAGRKGERVIVRYYDAKLKRWQVEDYVALLREDVEYSLSLVTPGRTYEHDRRIFNAVVSSFALTDEKYGEKYTWKTE